MSFSLKNLIRKNILDLVPYSSARDEFSGKEAIFLDANENPFNSPYNRYPDPYQSALKQKISNLKQVLPNQLFLGNGSDEAIDILFRIFCEPGIDNVVSIDPTYGMYKVAADINNVLLKKVPLTSALDLDVKALKKACDIHTRMLFICSPNNPTSNSFRKEDILELAESLDVMIIVDEAYIDFSSVGSITDQVSTHQNLVILQTLSKAWGLAGIRLGMAIADPVVIGYMSKVKYPYNVNSLTLQFAAEALEKKERVEKWISDILEERKLLERKFRMYRFVDKVYPSDANFILVKVKKPKKVYNFLLEKNIVVRDRSNIQLIENCLRVTIGTKEENLRLNEALMQYQRDFVESCEI